MVTLIKLNNLNILYILLIVIIFSCSEVKAKKYITVQSTTSTQNSGLYDYILPFYTKETQVEVRVVAVGTGQAIKNAEKCDGDVLLVHSKISEEEFVKKGYGLYRKDIMYNDFILIGPEYDPANIKDKKNINDVFTSIYKNKSIFLSRGDESGTHKAELRFWKAANLNITSFKGNWYRELGLGMGAALNVATQMDGYILSDRATWLAFKNKGNLKILFEGDAKLLNQYGIIPVNKVKCPSVKLIESEKFINWLISDIGQKLISSFKVNGHQLFFANYE